MTANPEEENLFKAQQDSALLQEVIKQEEALDCSQADCQVTCGAHIHGPGIASIQAAEIRYEELKLRTAEA